MSDIYQAPSSNLTDDSEGSQFGSIERGISGDYDLEFGTVLGEAWESTKGNKGTIWLAVLIVAVISIVVQLVTSLVLEIFLGPPVSTIIGQLVIILLTSPLTVGMFLIGVRCASNIEARSGSVLNYYDKMIPLFLTTVLMYILILIGFVLLIIPGIYLSVSYYFALPLVAEKNLSPWEALETSRKTVTHKWFTVFFLAIVISLILFVSAIPLLIGLIWTVPWSVLVFGTIYKKAFGVEQSTLHSN